MDSPRYQPVIQPKTTGQKADSRNKSFKPRESMIAPIIGAHRSYSTNMPILEVKRLASTRDFSPHATAAGVAKLPLSP